MSTIIECDFCGYRAICHTDDAELARESVEMKGWGLRKRGEERIDTCPYCTAHWDHETPAQRLARRAWAQEKQR